jgi:hypothetical protein
MAIRREGRDRSSAPQTSGRPAVDADDGRMEEDGPAGAEENATDTSLADALSSKLKLAPILARRLDVAGSASSGSFSSKVWAAAGGLQAVSKDCSIRFSLFARLFSHRLHTPIH